MDNVIKNTSKIRIVTSVETVDRPWCLLTCFHDCIESEYQCRRGQNGVFDRDTVSGGSCVLTSLPLKDSPITRVLQVARRMKRAKTGDQ